MILAMDNDIKPDGKVSATCCGMCGQQPDFLLQLGQLGAICVPCLIEAHDAAIDLLTAHGLVGSVSSSTLVATPPKRPALTLIK
jgi:hypothetical protein